MNDNNPHELNPQHELASAYLDGVASPAERAEVEASVGLQAVVASFTAIRAQVAGVEPGAANTRAAAFAAAFAEFDSSLISEAVPAANTTVIPLAATRRWVRPLLSAAAAVLVVGVVGVAINANIDTKDSSTSGANVEVNSKTQAADATQEATMRSDSMATMSTIGSIGGGAQAAQIIDGPDQLKSLAMAATNPDLTADSPQQTVAAAETTAGEALHSDEVFQVAADDRAAFGCLTEQQVFLADIQYQGIFAIAARDTVTGVTSAIADDCTVLATVGP